MLASMVPSVRAYDPAFGYELALIVEDGLRRMYGNGEDLIYYITLYNEKVRLPDMPEGVEEGVVKGLYRFREAADGDGHAAQILASGPIMFQALQAQEILAADFGVRADVWSATSFTELRREAIEVERHNLLHPDEDPRVPYITKTLEGAEGPVVAATDYVRVLADQVSRWVPGGIIALGTDGFGRSDTRSELRDFFEVDAKAIVAAVLSGLARDGKITAPEAAKGIEEVGMHVDRPAPWTVD